MWSYLIQRILLMIPTLFGILLLNFIIIQAAPGGPVEQVLAKLEGLDNTQASTRLGTSAASEQMNAQNDTGNYSGSQGIDADLIAEIEARFGFDRPAHERFFIMLKQYLSFDFGESFFRDASVLDLMLDKMPVSISLGLWSTLIIYLISIPLGIKKAVRHGTSFDVATSSILVIAYAIPSFLFALLLIVIFAGGSYLDWFPLRGLTSDDFASMTTLEKILDYFWHLILPVSASVISGFATLTLLTKNSFLDEIYKQYVLTARAKGLTEKRILYGHVFRNAMLIIIAGMPSALIGIFFTGSLLIEVMFSLDGLGLLGFEAIMQRDYPVIFATLYIYTLVGLLLKLLSDLTYMWVDPRIDFQSREKV
ncbi:microcin C transport system permease protein [Allopseudospirillum japonicum]|uniref:Inner membrane ABC transporter permease protein YejB n=1 Tax=Allopseudospirillum japonicum TaxID=64971 RepID=A0A1H6T602_9GAMM|nr:microcin C ABC transporter permease YejB [Allopseudospirillum japonicum]SEI75523.1 microcin C transport system permease protein [Allopseudospirillum japonicum]